MARLTKAVRKKLLENNEGLAPGRITKDATHGRKESAQFLADSSIFGQLVRTHGLTADTRTSGLHQKKYIGSYMRIKTRWIPTE